MVAELGDAGIDKALDRSLPLFQHATVNGKARAFEREDKAVRHLARPFAESCRRLCAIDVPLTSIEVSRSLA